MENPKDSVRSKGQNTKSTSLKRLQSIILHEARTLAQRPSMFEVIVLNDDVTPIEYVTQSLAQHFYKQSDEAASLALKIHHEGEAICGKYTREVAETKIAAIIEDARRFNHPLKCVMRKVK